MFFGLFARNHAFSAACSGPAVRVGLAVQFKPQDEVSAAGALLEGEAG
jgi:hypothetical protein